jgi:glutathione S-transferase
LSAGDGFAIIPPFIEERNFCMLRVYGSPMSRAGRVLWTLEELEQPYELKALDIRAGEQRSPEFLKINPAGKVPTLQDDDFVLMESAAICQYLAEKFKDKGLQPAAGSHEHARGQQWTFYAVTELEPPIWLAFLHKQHLPEPARIQQMVIQGEVDFNRALKVLADHLERNDYVNGKNFSVADIVVSSIVGWGTSMFPDTKTPPIQAYLDRLHARPAYKRYRERYSKN